MWLLLLITANPVFYTTYSWRIEHSQFYTRTTRWDISSIRKNNVSVIGKFPSVFPYYQDAFLVYRFCDRLDETHGHAHFRMTKASTEALTAAFPWIPRTRGSREIWQLQQRTYIEKKWKLIGRAIATSTHSSRGIWLYFQRLSLVSNESICLSQWLYSNDQMSVC